MGLFFLTTGFNVPNALDQYLTNHFDAFHSVNPKIALREILGLEHLQQNFLELPTRLDDQVQLDIPDEILQRVRA